MQAICIAAGKRVWGPAGGRFSLLLMPPTCTGAVSVLFRVTERHLAALQAG
jgi:hypothetical protein